MASNSPPSVEEKPTIEFQVPSLYNPQPIIHIDVQSSGDTIDTQSFNIHKDLLCYYSYFFQKECVLLTGDDKLPKFEVECPYPGDFGYFVKWVYTQDLDKADRRTSNLVYLWLIADDLATPKLQNQIMVWLEERRAFYTQVRSYRHSTLTYIYSQTLNTSPLRRYVADTWNEKIQTDDASTLPPALLVDIINSKSRRANLAGRIDPKDYFVDEKEVANKFAIPAEDIPRIGLEEVVMAAVPPLQVKKEVDENRQIKREVDENSNVVEDSQGPKKKKQKVTAKRRKSVYF